NGGCRMSMGNWGMRGAVMGGAGRGMGGGGGGVNDTSRLSNSEDDFGKAFDPKLMARLWTYVSPFKRRILLGSALLLVYTAALILNPLIPGLAINAIRDGDWGRLDLLCVAFFVDITVMWVAQYQQVYQMTWVSQHGLYAVAGDMFQHIVDLSLSFFDRN